MLQHFESKSFLGNVGRSIIQQLTLCLFELRCRLKALALEPYSQAEAERAGGMGCYVAPKEVFVQTQDLPSEMEHSS